MLCSKTYFTENRYQKITYKKYVLNEDQTIIFLHGFTSKKEDWNSPEVGTGTTYIEFFVNKGFRCIAIDCLSHGESSKPEEAANYDRSLLALDVISVMDAEKNSKSSFCWLFHGWLVGVLCGKILFKQATELNNWWALPWGRHC